MVGQHSWSGHSLKYCHIFTANAGASKSDRKLEISACRHLFSCSFLKFLPLIEMLRELPLTANFSGHNFRSRPQFPGRRCGFSESGEDAAVLLEGAGASNDSAFNSETSFCETRNFRCRSSTSASYLSHVSLEHLSATCCETSRMMDSTCDLEKT